MPFGRPKGRWEPIAVAARSKAWACGLSFAGIVGLNPTGGMDDCCGCCVLSGRGICVGLIARPEESDKSESVSECHREVS
jgi:hypothetical protein